VGPHRDDSVFNAVPSVIPAGIALVAAAILLAPRESEVGLLETAVAGFVLEFAAMLLPANGGLSLLWVQRWLTAIGWKVFAFALGALILTTGLGGSLGSADGAALLLAAVVWSLVWIVPPLRAVQVSECISISRSPDTVYSALVDISARAARNPRVLSSEALAGNRWRWRVKQPYGGTAEQTVLLVEAHRPYRLVTASQMGPSRLVMICQIRDHNGSVEVRATDNLILPYASALLGARWGGLGQHQAVLLGERLVDLREQLEVPANPAQSAMPADT